MFCVALKMFANNLLVLNVTKGLLIINFFFLNIIFYKFIEHKLNFNEGSDYSGFEIIGCGILGENKQMPLSKKQSSILPHFPN